MPKLDIDSADNKSGLARPLSQKHSARYLPDEKMSAPGGEDAYDLSARGNNMLCESDTSAVNMDDSSGVTPDLLAVKSKAPRKPLKP